MTRYQQPRKRVNRLPDLSELAPLVPIPADDAHKYSRGKAVVVAGSAPYPGAAMMCSVSSQLAGAGYTQVFTSRRNVKLVQQFRPSLVVAPFSELDPATAIAAQYPGAFVAGSGFDAADAEAEAALRRILKRGNAPVLVDGGALSFLSAPKMRKLLLKRQKQGLTTVLTPHWGEAQRLAAPYSIDLSRLPKEEAARSLSLCYGSIVVLKGQDTVIATTDQTAVVDFGTAALAKAGTGDVLAGLIGGFLAQGVAPFDAAHLGVAVHAVAGIVASELKGIVSVCAEDVLAAIPEAIQRIQRAQ